MSRHQADGHFAPPLGSVAVIVAAAQPHVRLAACLDSIARNASASAPEVVDPSAAAMRAALDAHAHHDALILTEPCLLTKELADRMRAAAYADTNTASASALVDAEGPLSLDLTASEEPDELASAVGRESLRLRPRLSQIVGPCVYLRRDALQLVGPVDATLDLATALEVDLAQRCLLAGLAHVAADDALAVRLGAPTAPRADPGAVRSRYPYLLEPDGSAFDPDPRPPGWAAVAASPALGRALAASRRADPRLSATIDGRALGTALTGTQRHILELIRAVMVTGEVDVRVLVSPDVGERALAELRSWGAELLAVAEIGPDTPRTTVFHRPQQVFEPEDVRLALRLGERLVVNQLDLIAYRNPGYHRDAKAWRSHRRVTRQALAAAEGIVVFSEHTRRDLLADELADAVRIHTIPPGLDHEEAEQARRPGGLADGFEARPFLLQLGTDFTHKNRVFALELLSALREGHGWDGRLVLAGTHIPHGSSREQEQGLLARTPSLAEAVVDLGPVADAEKGWLMGRAAAVLYPSTYEGFGLVPFEAGSSGVPCVFAARSSLEEVLPAELAAIVPWDAQLSAARVIELLQDPRARARHVSALAAARERFRWSETARASVAVYRETAIAPVPEARQLSRDELSRETETRELVAAQDRVSAQLAVERDHARSMYDDLNAEVGSGLALIGPHGAMPEDLQRGLLALSANGPVSRPIFAALAALFRLARAIRPGRRDRPPSAD
ncbi:MAG TPA: glycosyltransferase [Solirubrobacteraceae bacterium]|nr:glycosyltransferase [Solirubrobacteraceae bacterium]